MKEQFTIDSLSGHHADVIARGTPTQIAELIAETSTYSQTLKLRQVMHVDKWEVVKNELKSMFVVNPEKIYTSYQFLNADKLMLIRDIFKEEGNLEPMFFQNQSAFVLLAVTEGFLLQDLSGEKMSRLKQYFIKNLKKQSSFWGLSQLQSLQTYISDPTTGYFTDFNTIQHELQLDRFSYFYQFCINYQAMFPQSTDISSILLKMILCLRQERERDKVFMGKFKKMYFESKYHFLTTMKNMKFALQFLRNKFLQKECMYYPQKSINSILQRYNIEQIQNLLDGSCLGLKWNALTIYNYFTSCIKLGITESTSKFMTAMIRFCEKHHKYSELIYNYENNLSRLFIFLKHPKHFELTSKLLKFFIYSPPPQLSLYQKFVQKAIPLSTTISQEILYPYLNMLQTVVFLYKDTTTVTDLTAIIDSLIGQKVNRLTEQEMKQQLNQYSWKVKVKNKTYNNLVPKQTGYRGMTNIGNSCYMNSFLQSLFMNRQFTKEILSVSTLQLQRQRLKSTTFQGKDPVAVSKQLREDLRPLAELQRLFALLLSSKKSEITPLPIRNISPPEFKNNYQHDSIQFGRLFLDVLYKNQINKIFEGEMSTSIECEGCRSIRERKEIFLDLIVTPQKDQQEMEETIDAAFSNQIMHDLICDFCNERRDNSIKRHMVSKFPNYLIVSIKRFLYSVTEKKNSKIMTKINIKSSISLGNQQYDLYSLIIHRGPSPNAGHYFSFSKLNYEANSKWICHNDSEVTQLQGYKEVTEFLDNNQSDTPYILFFEKSEHIMQVKEELIKPIVLRKPLEQYVQRDFLEEQKSKQKKILPLYRPINYASFFKKDDDDEDGNQNQPFYNNYIL